MSARIREIVLALGDCCAGGVIGGVTAAAVRAVVSPEWDMVLVMPVGMAAGMVVSMALGLALLPLLGAFHVMVPGSMIGMYGGMLFAMRDTMQHPPGTTAKAALIGLAFGVLVSAGVRMYDTALRGPRVLTRSG